MISLKMYRDWTFHLLKLHLIEFNYNLKNSRLENKAAVFFVRCLCN